MAFFATLTREFHQDMQRLAYTMRRLFAICLITLLAIKTLAQEATCPVIQRAAVTEARQWCANLAPGELCYGNAPVNTDQLSDAPFQSVGDTLVLADSTRITTQIIEDEYGIALVQTTGYQTSNWAAQPLTIALLGDTTLTNTGNENINLATVTSRVISEAGANIRSGPSRDYGIIATVAFDEPVKIIGRSANSDAYYLQLPWGEHGWLASAVVQAVDVSDLPIITADTPEPQPIYAPYTAFSLQTGHDDAPCALAWQSGVLVQVPLGERVRLQANEIDILFTGTLFIQAQQDETTFYSIEGDIAYGDNIIQEGYQLRIRANSIKFFAYDFNQLAPLPTEILPRYVYIGLDLETIITPAPQADRSPIADVLVTEPCVVTTGESGANLRAGPSREFGIRGVLAYRETAHPIGRTQDSNGTIWWELAQNVWISSQVVVTGGDCVAVPQSERIPVPLPTATPQAN